MKTRILMVCLGNICRSPLAEGILASKLDSNYHIGKKPDSRSIAIAKAHGIDISNQKASQFKVNHFSTFDHIYVMDTSNYQNVIQLAKNEIDKNKGSLILNQLHPNENIDVPDPYYGGEQGFADVYDMLDRATDKILATLKA